MIDSRYTSDDYLQTTRGTWHLEDSPWKARQVAQLLERQGLVPERICEIGCGAGGVLAELAELLPTARRLVGFDVSDRAIELCRQWDEERLEFYTGEGLDAAGPFDLALALDVAEHVEDLFGFLRRMRERAAWKVYHVPLEITLWYALSRRGLATWRRIGHLHKFTVDTALEALRYTNHEILDYHLTAVWQSGQRQRWRTQLAALPRTALGAINRQWAQRLLGGYSLLVLAR